MAHPVFKSFDYGVPDLEYSGRIERGAVEGSVLECASEYDRRTLVLKDGKIYTKNKEGLLEPTNAPIASLSSLPAKAEGDGVRILGAPAIVLENRAVDISSIASAGSETVRATVGLGGVVIFARERRTPAPGGSERITTSSYPSPEG